MLKMRLKYRAVFPNRGAIYDYSGVTQAGASFNISLKNTFSKCYRTLKQIAMGSPLGGANYNYLPQGVASQKRLGNTVLEGQYRKTLFELCIGKVERISTKSRRHNVIVEL